MPSVSGEHSTAQARFVCYTRAMLALIPRSLFKFLFIVRSLTTRAMTMGVKAYIKREDGSVLLVRHTYCDGWHLPGGGVERGETVHQTLLKEVLEEVGIKLGGTPKIFHVYKNDRTSRYDHVVLFVCPDWEQVREWEPNAEIAEIGFFPADELPKDITPYTRQRLLELRGETKPSDHW